MIRSADDDHIFFQEWELFTGLIVDDVTIHSADDIKWIGDEQKTSTAKLQVSLSICLKYKLLYTNCAVIYYSVREL